MHQSRFLVPTLALALISGATLPQLSAADAAAATSFEDAIKAGSFGGMLRYRADYYDEDNGPTSDPGLASTLRTSLFYQSKPWYGVSGFVELYHIASIGAARYAPESPNRDFIIDPVSMGVNQAYGQYGTIAPFPVTVTVGRQLFTINDETFVTASRYRQNNDRNDAATFHAEPIQHLTIEGGQIWHNVDVTDAVHPMSTQVGNIAYALPDQGRLAVYGVILNYEDDPNLAAVPFAAGAIDRTTYGIRLDGPYKIDDQLSVIYEADFAKQSDSGDTPAKIDAQMYTVRIGANVSQWYGSVGYRQASGAKEPGELAFQSSDLGYPWPWRGNSEQLVFNPPSGLKTFMAWVGGAVPGVAGLSFDVFYFDFKSAETSTKFGTEISGGLNYNVTKRWSLYGLATKADQGDEGNGAFNSATRLTGMTTFTF